MTKRAGIGFLVLGLLLGGLIYFRSLTPSPRQQIAAVGGISPVIYADNQLTANCDGNYSIAKRDCSGTDGSAFPQINAALALAGPGSTVYVRAGTYYGGVLFTQGGQAGAYLSLQPYAGEAVTINPGQLQSWTREGDYYTLDYGNLDYNTIQLFERDNYGIFRVKTLAELTPATGALTANYSLVYVDQGSHKIYLRWLGNGSPDNSVYVVDASRRVEVSANAPYVEIKGFSILYGYEGIKSYGDYTHIVGNTIQFNDQGILSGANNLLIENNRFSYSGFKINYTADDTGYRLNNQNHAIYLGGGSGTIIRNNFTEKCTGGCFNLASSAADRKVPTNASYYNNVVHGGADIGGTNSKIYNNLFYDYASFQATGDGNDVFNNYFEVNNNIPSANAVYLAPYAIARNFKFRNNLVFSTTRDYCLDTGYLDLASADLNRNLYVNCGYFGIGRDGDPQAPARQIKTTLSDFVKALAAFNSKLETESVSAAATGLSGTDLSPSSPAVDAGTCLPGLTTDYRGTTRPQGSSCDIGPIELVQNIPITNFTLSPQTDGNGSLSPATPTTVPAGQNQTFTITPNSGYELSSLLVDGQSRAANVSAAGTSYTFTNVQANHTIAVNFEPIPPNTNTLPPNPNQPPVPLPTPAATSSAAVLPPVTTPRFAPLTSLFAINTTGPHVSQLQQMLTADGVYQGPISGNYDDQTIQAVQRFQVKYGLLTQGSPNTNGFGLSGPATRAKLNQLYARTAVSPTGTALSPDQRLALIRQLQVQLLGLLRELLSLLEGRR